MKHGLIALAGLGLAWAGAAEAQGTFVNGGFENGTSSGWTQGAGSRTGSLNPLNPNAFLPGGANYNSAYLSQSGIVTAGQTDQYVGSVVYSGNYAWRVGDTTNGGYASVLQQRVNNYQDANIFFAWKAVLENGGHAANASAVMVITLQDLTTNSELIRRDYNATATSGGTDPRFQTSGSFYYTPTWQIERLAIDQSLAGHDFLLTILGADCQPAGHEGYLFLDGFGAVTPPVVDGAVPEPATWATMILGFGAIGGAMRRRKRPAMSVSYA